MSPNVFSNMNMASAKTLVSTAASIAASAMVIRSITRDIIPYEFQLYISSGIRNFLKSYSSDVILIIEEYEGFLKNQIYKAADIYLGTKISPSTQMFKVSMPEKETKISTFMVKNQEILDNFNGVQFKWRQVTRMVENKQSTYPGQSKSQTEVRYFELSFHKKHKEMVFDTYFPFLLKESKNLKDQNKTLKIFTLNGGNMHRYMGQDSAWSSINLDHPATFDTLAMDVEPKKMIMEDLERFVKRKEFYRKVGKAWKRGYLLYGPPGTGKSSLIAAMANYLKFDIYDLELTDLHANSELRRLLIATANRSILVVEDIDCGLDFDDQQAQARVLDTLRSNQVNQAQTVNIIQKNKPKVTLSGLLNFIDGLWSSCGDERIIVFTTNHKDRLDPALLRPGRMDVHIHMSYCTPCGFDTLAGNYLQLTDGHSLFSKIKDMLEKIKVTPAEVGEQLLKNEDPEIVLQGLVEFLFEKKRENEEIEARKVGGNDGKEIETENSVEKNLVPNNATLA